MRTRVSVPHVLLDVDTDARRFPDMNRCSYRTLATVLGLLAFGVICRHAALALQELPSSTSKAGSSPGRQMPFTIRVTTREVLVDVVATDSHGHAINDLTASDFRIFEVGDHSHKSPRMISAFRIIDPAEPLSDAPSSGLRVTLGGGCAASTMLHYQIAYHPSSDAWKSGFHEVRLTTSRRDVRLSYRQRYFVGETQAQPGALARDEARNRARDAGVLQEAACYHSPTPLSLSLSARLVETGERGALRYALNVDADSLSFVSLSEEARRVQLDYGICTFDSEGKTLRYMSTSADRALTSDEYLNAKTHGFPNRIEFPRLGDPALVRFVVRDRETGNLGAVEEVITPPVAEVTESETKAAEGGRQPVVASYENVDYVQGPVGSFGSIVSTPGSLCGDVYELEEGTQKLPNFWNFNAVGTLHAFTLDVPPQRFLNTGGIPGITRRTEWFGIDYHGAFLVRTPGEYEFELTSDDGARLYIDDGLLISLDGTHSARTKSARIDLGPGRHTIHVPYFEGPLAVALVLLVKPPGGQLELFDMRNFAGRSGSDTPPAF
ncbi:MAG TPA: PA14 domain-containing protein [Acidisarcina sp.]